jgi:hypothetical protein
MSWETKTTHDCGAFRSDYRLKDGERMSRASSEFILKPNEAFKKRWSIEPFFAVLKSRGFSLEIVGCRPHGVFLVCLRY